MSSHVRQSSAVHRRVQDRGGAPGDDSGRSIAEVARELSLNEVTLGNWVREERRRLASLEGTDAQPLSAAERAEPQRLRKQVAEQEKDIAFLGKAAAYFASNPPKQSGSR